MICKVCGKTFLKNNNRQIYCSKKCYLIVRNKTTAKYKHEHYLKNKDKVLKRTKEWKLNNLELVRFRNKLYARNHQDRAKKYYLANRDRFSDLRKEYNKTYRKNINNIPKIRESKSLRKIFKCPIKKIDPVVKKITAINRAFNKNKLSKDVISKIVKGETYAAYS